MLKLTVGDLLSAVHGTLLAGERTQTITAVETDSRACCAGALFVPLIAARDGHDFIGAALSAGAEGTLCSRRPEAFVPGKFYIHAEDTRLALKALASWYRGRFDIPFVQITGSVGKTTTKEMIAAVLSEHFCTLKTEGNFNNDIGVPKTLLRLMPEHEAAVIETGMNHFGEIRYLGEMVRPDIAVISNVGDAHIENLGSREGILRAKSEIFEHLKKTGFAVLNGDDALLNTLHPDVPVYRCGEGKHCDVRVSRVEEHGIEEVSCRVETGQERYDLRIPAPGRHMIYSAAMAAVIGRQLGLSREEIQAGVAHYEPAGERMRRIERPDGVLILSDCYNANPQSMAAAIHTLARSGRAQTVAVLGDMGELGALSPQAHYEMGACCAKEGVETVIAVGEQSKEIARGAREGGCTDVHWCAGREQACALLSAVLRKHAAVLVKASHAMQFQQITAYLTNLSEI